MKWPQVAVVVPTHDHPETLELSVSSVLEQDFADLAVVVLADGVTEESRSVLSRLKRADNRVQVIDRPKSPRHAEVVRHEVLSTPGFSPLAVYHGDDDLMLPDHVSTMVALLAENDFAHPLPLLVLPDDTPEYRPADLARPASIDWHLGEPWRNAISLTGVAHTLDAYRRLPHGWRETPPGRWTDHYMWQQFFLSPGFRGVTSPKATTIKIVTEPGMPDAREVRRRRIASWWQRMHAPGFRQEWDNEVAAAVRSAALTYVLEFTRLQEAHEALTEAYRQLEVDVVQCGQHLAEAVEQNRQLDLDVAGMANSRSWRMTAPLRAVMRRLPR